MPEQTENKTTKKIYNDPISVAKRTKQTVHFVGEHDKPAFLEHILKNNSSKPCVIITKSKRSADELSKYLDSKEIKALAIHGNHRAEQIENAAKSYNAGELNILITTDMILQSLDLSNIELIVSYNLPSDPKHYLSRLGYLKEVGESIAMVSPEDDKLLDAIEFTMKMEIEQVELESFIPTPHSHADKMQKSAKDKKKKPRHSKKRAKKESKLKEEKQE